jgi:ankyrin repeat protein
MAAEIGNLEYLQMCLRELHGLPAAQVNSKGEDEWNALHHATSEGHLDIIEFLVNHPEIEIDCQTANHRTPLHIACIR